MKISVLLLLLLALFALSGTVTVTEGDFHFPLESVKVLRTLFPRDKASARHSLQEMESKAEAVCSHPQLPAEFHSLCLRSDAGASMARLVSLSLHPDACDICESVACTGC